MCEEMSCNNNNDNERRLRIYDGHWDSNRRPPAPLPTQNSLQDNQHTIRLKQTSEAVYDNSWPPEPSSPSQHKIWHCNVPLTPSPTPSSPMEPPPPANRSIYPLQTQPGYRVTVTPYNTSWPSQFTTIKSHLHQLFTNSTPSAPYTTIEHIGSTSIPGLPAKPNIDVLVTFPNATSLQAGIDALEWEIPDTPPFTRYTRIPGGGGIQGRESFKLYVPETSEYYLSTPERSVYLIDESGENHAGRVQIRCYRAVRETLRDSVNGDLLEEYADVKVELGSRVYEDSIAYSRLKNGVVGKVLRRAGWTEEEINEKERLSERVWVGNELPY